VVFVKTKGKTEKGIFFCIFPTVKEEKVFPGKGAAKSVKRNGVSGCPKIFGSYHRSSEGPAGKEIVPRDGRGQPAVKKGHSPLEEGNLPPFRFSGANGTRGKGGRTIHQLKRKKEKGGRVGFPLHKK